MTRPLLKHLPNALTASRGILGFVVLYCGFTERWTLGFWMMFAALLTDFFDGLAAKKLHARSKLGTILDPIADCLLAACGLVSLSAAGKISWWLIPIMALSAVGIGYIKFIRSDKPRWQHILQLFSVAYLFIVWSFIAIYFLALAYGWSWLYPVIALLLLLGAAALKRHRLRAWYGWLRA